MCDALLFGTAAIANPFTGAITSAATSGLFGSAGAFGLGSALSTLGTVGGLLGSFQQGYGQAQTYNYNAQVAAQNAEIARRQAAYDEKLARERSLRVLGQGRAGVAKSGITLSGSALDVMANAAADAELQALSIRCGGGIQSANSMARSGLDRMTAQQRLTSAYVGAGTNLLTDASRASFGAPPGGTSAPVVLAGSGAAQPRYWV
jgi:hypothetical protein